MKIVILSHDLSHNCLGRAVLLAQLLGRRHEVEIVGASFGPDVWFPCRKMFTYRKIEGEIFLPEFTSLFARLIDKLRGDCILAVKPRPTSFGAAILHRELTGRPIWLDIDDDEMAFYESDDWKAWDRKTLLRRPNSPMYTALLERLVPTADAISAASRTLCARWGGVYLPHVKDPQFLDPARYDKRVERDRRHISSEDRVILFAGSPREHKGLDLLLDALERVRIDKVRLVVMGGTNDPDHTIESELRKRGGERLTLLKQFPMSELPSALAMADLVVIPQRPTAAAQAQIPSKLFDAMAMGLPVISTDVSDAREILEPDCGWVVAADDSGALAAAIEEVLGASSLAAERRRNARRRLVERYSFEAADPVVDRMLHRVTEGRHDGITIAG